jgi:IS5 family transposase
MIEMRRAQLSFGDGLIADEVSDLREDWMLHADEVLADERIVAMVYEALAQRHPKSRSRGRLGAPAEMVLRLLRPSPRQFPPFDRGSRPRRDLR